MLLHQGATQQPPLSAGPNWEHPLVRPGGYLINGGSSVLPNVLTGELATVSDGNALTVEMSGGFRCTRFNETIVNWSRPGNRFESGEFSGFLMLIDHVDNGQAQSGWTISTGAFGWAQELEFFSNNQNLSWSNFGTAPTGGDFNSSLGTLFGAKVLYAGFSLDYSDPHTVTLYRIDQDVGITEETSGSLARGNQPTDEIMQIGGRAGDTAEFRLDANVICGAVLPGKWSLRDHIMVRNNPWQLLEQQRLTLVLPSGDKTVTANLVDIGGAAQINLTGLRWSWFNEGSPGIMSAPSDQGTVETTDGSGQIILQVPNTTLTAGQTGFLLLRDPAGLFIGGYRLTVD
jgi:hypothetical protein